MVLFVTHHVEITAVNGFLPRQEGGSLLGLKSLYQVNSEVPLVQFFIIFLLVLNPKVLQFDLLVSLILFDLLLLLDVLKLLWGKAIKPLLMMQLSRTLHSLLEGVAHLVLQRLEAVLATVFLRMRILEYLDCVSD